MAAAEAEVEEDEDEDEDEDEEEAAGGENVVLLELGGVEVEDVLVTLDKSLLIAPLPFFTTIDSRYSASFATSKVNRSPAL